MRLYFFLEISYCEWIRSCHLLEALLGLAGHMDFKGPDSLAQAYKLNGTILGGYNFIIDEPKKKPDNNRETLASVVIGMVVPITEGGRSNRRWVVTAAEMVMDVIEIMGDDLED